jgi:outer membrane receptor protein involved in Fe transport
VGNPPWMFVAFQPQVITQNAFFGDATWKITDQFSLEGGLRHYHYSLSNSDNEYGVFAPNATWATTCRTLPPSPMRPAARCRA